MVEYMFRYEDGIGTTITRIHWFETDRDALDAGSFTFERFSVRISRDHKLIGAFAANGAARPVHPEAIAS